jgi:nucleoside-diphosphate-sugar epimerase
VIIRPPNVLGPGQEELRDILRIIEKRFKPLIGNGDEQLSIVFVQDLVRGIEMAAVHRKTAGRTYFITDGKTYSWKGIADAVAEKLGVSGFCVPVYHPLLVVLASLAGAAAKVRGKASFFNARQVKYLRETYQIYDGSKAGRDFGFEPALDLAGGIEKVVDWYLTKGRR